MTKISQQSFYLPELSIIGSDSFENEPSSAPAKQPSKSVDDRFLASLASVCAASDKDSLVENLVKQSYGLVGFGPMVAALGSYRA